MLYAIGSDDGLVKIGITRNIQARLSALQTASPRRLEVLKTWDVGLRDKAAETRLHWQLGRYRQNGEWFLLSSAGLDWLLRCLPSDFEEEPAKQMIFGDMTPSAKEVTPFRLSEQFLAWLNDVAPRRSNRTETLERIGALPPAEREVIAQMLAGEWKPQEVPHRFSEMLTWDEDLAAILRKHPKIMNRVENMVQAEQSYLTGNNLPYWVSDGSGFFADTNGPIYEVQEIERVPVDD